MGWRTWATAIVAAQFAAVLIVGTIAGFRYGLPLVGYWKAALGVAIIGTGIYAIVQVALCIVRKEDRPGKAVLSSVIRCDLPLVAFLVATQLALLGWLKAMMPYTVGFWADPMLADLDAMLLGGDPWKPLHLLPIGTAFDQVYLTWAPFSLATAIAVSFAPDDVRKGRCFIAYFLTLSAGALGQYLLPSAGPVFYEAIGLGRRFADMPIQPWVRHTADYLWLTYSSPGFRIGSGISAWPSVHVAGAFWIALVMRCYLPRLQMLGWLYAATILIGSVYLGWHYAVDGIAGAALAFIAFAVAGRLSASGGKQGRQLSQPLVDALAK